MAEPDGDADGEGIVKLKNVIEKPYPGQSPSEMALAGRYVFVPEVFDLLEKDLAADKGVVDLSGAINALSAKDALYGKVVEGRRYDIGERIDYVEATLRLGMKREDVGPDIEDLITRIAGELG